MIGKEERTNRVLLAISEEYGVAVADIYGQSRQSGISEARQMCIMILYRRLRLSVSEIGRLLSRRHSTVIYSLRRIEALVEVDTVARCHYERIAGRYI